MWGVLLHTNAGLLLGAALVAGNGVAGGVVAYQVAFVFFLAPYAVFAQPIHTAILPELANEAARDDVDAFAGSVRWAIDRMAVLVVPVAAALVALALPIMQVVAFGQATRTGPPLLAAALASLAIGLLPYAALLLFARAFYALGDSRTPAVVATASAVVGVATMATLAPMTHGTARVAVLGAGHTVAYLVGAVILGGLLVRRLERPLVPRLTGVASASAIPIAAAAWVTMRHVDPSGRIATAMLLVVLVVIGAVGVHVGNPPLVAHGGFIGAGVSSRAGRIVLFAALGGAVVWSAQPAHAADARPPVHRVLVLSLPGVRWADIPGAEVPNLRALFAQSGLADMSVRGANDHPTLADGYVTMGTGARAEARPRTGDCDMTGPGDWSCPAQRAIASHNDALLFDAQVGLLGDTLVRAGCRIVAWWRVRAVAPMTLRSRSPITTALYAATGVIAR